MVEVGRGRQLGCWGFWLPWLLAPPYLSSPQALVYSQPMRMKECYSGSQGLRTP